MHPPRYLFLHADTNDIFTTDEEPTLEDLEGAEVGTQVIMRLADLHFYGYAAKWLPIPAGKLTFTDTEDNRGRPFHYPPTDDPALELARRMGQSALFELPPPPTAAKRGSAPRRS